MPAPSRFSRPCRSRSAVVGLVGLAVVGAGAVRAQGVATEQQLQAVTITGSGSARNALDPNLPTTTASRDLSEIREQQNVFNPEDVLVNMPNTTVRKRYSGDRNALIGGRSFGTSQAPRGLVLMDGYLISNFLGAFDAPRWNMVAPEEMERVDVLYGPFSAIYPGNAIGTTVAITTRRPRAFEGSARVAAQSQHFSQYGHDAVYDNNQATAMLGNRWDGGAWARLMLSRQDATGQPMQWYTVNADAAGVFAPPAGSGTATPVSGVIYDVGPNGLARAVFGANGGAIDHTVQNTAKLTAGWDIGDVLAVEGMIAGWDNRSRTRNETYLRDAAGNAVWSGRVSSEGHVFVLPATAFAPSARDEDHLQYGVTVKTRRKAGWNASLVASRYRIGGDLQRTANGPDPAAAEGGPGVGVARDGTGFRTMELQAAYTPTPDDWTGGAHALTLGLHDNDYRLQQSTTALPDWRSSAGGTPMQFVGGATSLQAFYLQDGWRFAPGWRLTAGVRAERWKAFDGVQRVMPGATVAYADRRISATSPKLSLAWDPAPDWTLRASAGRGTRFPTVAELFQGTVSGSSIVVNDPDLKPEVGRSRELFAERRFETATLRASLFEDDVRDTIFRQTNLAVFPNVTNTQNISRVRTRGLELAGTWEDAGLRGLSLDASIAFNQPRILANDNNPDTVGKDWVRVPRVRSAATATYRFARQWVLSGTWRYGGRQYNELSNVDVNPDVYGGLSRVRQLDLRLLWKPAAGAELALGVDNATGSHAYQSHPLQGRSFFVEARHGF